MTDGAPDRPADPANTLGFTVNLTQCLTSHGISWSSGEELQVTLLARAAGSDSAEQGFGLERA